MQNPHFGSKIKIPKNTSKSILQIIYSCSVQKTAPKNTKYSRNESILKIGHHAKAIAFAKCSLWSKIKIPKNISKSILQIIYSCSVQKTAPKNTKYSRNESILKIGHHAKAIAFAKSSLWSKIKIPKNISKSILQIIYSCSVQKTAPKNTKYSRNESILKIGHHAKAIAFAKSSLWVKN